MLKNSQKVWLVLVRHGQSTANMNKLWAGWTDVELSQRGITEAKQCALLLKQKQLSFQKSYCSVLQRSKRTLQTIAESVSIGDRCETWRLNQRHYGILEGQYKPQITELYGKDKVNYWRRSLDGKPPDVQITDSRHPKQNPLYSQLEYQPGSESLTDVMKRLSPLWTMDLTQSLKEGKSCLVVGHGSSLRALRILMEKSKAQQLALIEVPTAMPILYELNKVSLSVEAFHQLGDFEKRKEREERSRSEIQ